MSEDRERLPSLWQEMALGSANALHDGKGALERHWPFFVALGIALLAAVIGLATGIDRLGGRWAYAYQHGYLLVGMGAWLLFRSLRDGTIAHLGPSWLGFALLFAATLTYGLTELLDFTLGLQMMLPALFFALILALGGMQLASFFLLPVSLIYFAVPVWDLTNAPLQAITTWVVTHVLSLGNIPVHVDGNMVHIAAGTFEIAEGCSGRRYFVVSLALAAFYGFSWLRRWSNRTWLLLAAGGMAIFSNWVRVYALILIGEVSGMDHYLIGEHDEFGWIVFFVLMAPVFWFARRLELRESRIEDTAAPGSGVLHKAPMGTFALAGLAAALVLASPALLRAGAAAPEVPAEVELSSLADGRWSGIEGDARWRPVFERPHQEGQVRFGHEGGEWVDVYFARYATQQPDSKLIWHRNSLTDGWHAAASREAQIEVNGARRQVREVELAAQGERRLIWHWYTVGGVVAHGRMRAKLQEIPALLRGRRDGAVVALSASCEIGCDSAREAMTAFLENAATKLDALAASANE